MSIFHLLVGEHLYCSRDCWEQHKYESMQRGLISLVECGAVLKRQLPPEKTQGLDEVMSLIERAQELICQRNSWRENLIGLGKLGTKNGNEP